MRRMIANLLVVFLCAAFCLAQQSKYKPLPPFEMPADVDVRKADINSEGTRMSAEVFTTKANAGQKLPVILMGRCGRLAAPGSGRFRAGGLLRHHLRLPRVGT